MIKKMRMRMNEMNTKVKGDANTGEGDENADQGDEKNFSRI